MLQMDGGIYKQGAQSDSPRVSVHNTKHETTMSWLKAQGFDMETALTELST